MNRILDISEEPAGLSVRLENLVISREGVMDVTIPIREVAAIVVSHPRVHYTHSVLAKLAAAGGIFVTCDEKRLPIGMILPLQAHFAQAERMRAQAMASVPTRKRLWKQIVQAKIKAQGAILLELRGDDQGLAELAQRVRSGDTGNAEAQASRRYWPALFSREDFRRDPGAEDVNRHLNYGYAVLRAIVARATCGVGLHPGLGLHHHNRYDPFPLVDDLMEPFRPVVDRVVVEMERVRGPDLELDREAKSTLIQGLMAKQESNGESRTLFDFAERLASSLAAALMGSGSELAIPEFLARPGGSVEKRETKPGSQGLG